jgi:hypothetical protein
MMETTRTAPALTIQNKLVGSNGLQDGRLGSGSVRATSGAHPASYTLFQGLFL